MHSRPLKTRKAKPVSVYDGYSATATPGPPNADWNTPNNGWRVTLKNKRGKRMTVPFYMGIGLKGEPSAADVLECLISDAIGYRNAASFEDWASDYGYDPDSRAAEKTYRACGRISDRLEKFLTPEEFEALAYPEDEEND